MARSLLEEIARQISLLTARMHELEQERAGLERTFRRLREEDDVVRRADVTRKNSVPRILAENAVLAVLRTAKRQRNPAVPTKALFGFAKNSVADLHPGNFRSILHRMKLRGMIEAGGRGRWLLASEETPQQPKAR